nr:2-amino-4-hydroxy-6-hydroxymethyldihydropteridine diphosphokinase [Marinicella rhabdoformis]
MGLGSNLSNPHRQIKKAVQFLNAHPNISVIDQAPCFKTPAWGVTDQPDFINSALTISTTLSPHQLLNTIKEIEYEKLGRVKNKRWHERLIDIDILVYGLEQLNHESLTIPHPLITERWFVILPLLLLQPHLPIKLAIKLHAKISQQSAPKDIIKLT